MRQSGQYEKLFSRDFSLASVQAWIRGESTNPKGWTDKKQPFLPYIIALRADDTVHFYYDLQGVAWVQNLLVKLAKNNKNFIPKIEKTVLEKLAFIRPIYEKEAAISLFQLKRFLKELEAGYPWFEAMWWFFQMNDESKIAGLDLENLGKVRVLTDKLCNSSDTVIRKSLLNLYPDLADLSTVLTAEEIFSEEVPGLEILKKRYQGYFYAENQLFISKCKTDIEKNFTISFKIESIPKTRQLNGLSAYQGIVRGFARRVMGHKQIGEVKEGEILISPMTTPDFVPAMLKAAAIVTDEGGILCHAAIVAREFKKPTVVGTQFATQIFNDGDFIEVDANTGIITLINKT